METHVKIEGILLSCDESVLNLNFGNDYSIKKIYLSDLPYKDRIADGRGNLATPYFLSAQKDENGQFFICLDKEIAYSMQPPQCLVPGVYTNEQLRCTDQLNEFHWQENQHLLKIFSLLHVFKEGNIGTKQIFFTHHFSYGIVNSTITHISDNVTRNFADDRKFSLTSTELVECNQFLTDYSGVEYSLLKQSINRFILGLAQVPCSTSFEQFTTVLEMTLLSRNQEGKKEVLAKRSAVLLETNATKIAQLYHKMKMFYRYRSESLHEGDDQHITNTERQELENIVRRILRECLKRCKTELTLNPSIVWDEVKTKIVNDLKAKVKTEEIAGTFDP